MTRKGILAVVSGSAGVAEREVGGSEDLRRFCTDSSALRPCLGAMDGSEGES